MIKKLLFCLGMVGFLASCSSQGSKSTPSKSMDDKASKTVVIQGATIIDGTGSPAMKDSTIVSVDGRITQIGANSGISVPAGAKVVDAKGKWITPGFIDTHIHVYESGRLYTSPALYDLRKYRTEAEEHEWIKKRVEYTLSRFLCSGVTSFAQMSGPFWSTSVREITRTTSPSPRMTTAGRFIGNAPFGEFNFWSEEDPGVTFARDPEHARQIVREQLSETPDMIKTGYLNVPNHSVADYQKIVEALVDEGKKHGLRVASHTLELDSSKAVIRAGSNILVHTMYEPVDQEFIELAKKNDAIISSSIAVFESYEEVTEERAKIIDIEKECGDPEVIASWNDLSKIPKNERPPLSPLVSDGERKMKIIMENLKKMSDAGVRLSVGSDAGNVGLLHGSSLHRELELMAEAGIDPMTILVSATKNGADVMSANPDFGTLEVGKSTDLLILSADPLVDIRNASKIEYVVNKGQVLEQNSLHSANYPSE